MTEADVVTLLRDAVWITIKLSSPILILGMFVGFLISVFQTTTSIQEQTLTFVPKFIAILVALVLLSGWMIQVLKDYTGDLFTIISKL